MKKTTIGLIIILICAGFIYAATLDRLPRADVAVLDTDKIIEVQCGAQAHGKNIKLDIPDKLFDLAISTWIVYNKDVSKGAVIRMRVPDKYADAVSARVLEICASCTILSVSAVPVPTPTAVR